LPFLKTVMMLERGSTEKAYSVGRDNNYFLRRLHNYLFGVYEGNLRIFQALLTNASFASSCSTQRVNSRSKATLETSKLEVWLETELLLLPVELYRASKPFKSAFALGAEYGCGEPIMLGETIFINSFNKATLNPG